MHATGTAAAYGNPECVAAIMTASVWGSTDMQATRRSVEAMLLYNAKDVATINECLKHIAHVAGAVGIMVVETGYFLLYRAVQAKRPVQVFCKLLKLGADPLAKDKNGQTPADLARAEGQTLIAQLLDRAAQDTKEQLDAATAT